MPNHVTAICTVTGPTDVIDVFVAKHIAKTFDFETILPTPECIKGTSSDSMTELAMLAYLGSRAGASVMFDLYGTVSGIVSGPGYKHADQILAWLAEKQPDALVSARKSFAALAETGFGNWYEWNVHNWGTKWNSYQFAARQHTDDRYEFTFQTAWSFPKPIFRKLAELYPMLEFAIIAYDEGSNFACTGSFNGPNDFAVVEATDDLYERVYGRSRKREEDE